MCEGDAKFGDKMSYTTLIATVISICIALIAILGYVRLVLKRKKRRARRALQDEAERQELSDRMVDRLRDAFLFEKEIRDDRR